MSLSRTAAVSPVARQNYRVFGRVSLLALVAGLLSSSLVCTSGLAADAKAAPLVVPVFELKGEITDKPPAEDPLLGNIGAESLQSLLTRIKKAGKDDNVAAVLLLLNASSLHMAQVEELRQALAELQKSKPVYAHADSVTTNSYALLCAAKRASMSPTGDCWITGIFMEELYLRGLFDMLGVQPEFLTCGKYKSAAEMFMRKKSSAEALEMHNWILDSAYQTVVKMIAESRQVDEAQVKAWIDQGMYSAEKAKETKLIDAVESREELLALVKKEHGANVKLDKKYAKKSLGNVDLENPFALMQIWAELLSGSKKSKSTKNAVAVVHVDGPIMLGTAEHSLLGSSEGAYSESIRKALDKVADEPRIRAVVLRVNSPGGSATASEIILKAVRNVQTQKPVIVSMGNVAASGGYYISCRGERIFADGATLTGSIGVVAGKLATDQMWQKVGVNFDSLQRGKRAGLMHSDKPWNDEEKEQLQSWMDEVYGVFKSHVEEGRKDKLTKPIDDMAGGRVYTGQQAKDLGLVDEIGSLSDAIAFAAKKVELEDYEIRTFPEQKNFLEELLSDLGETNKEDDKRISVGLWSAVAPALGELDRQHSVMVFEALRQLDFLQQERVMLTMPVLRLQDH